MSDPIRVAVVGGGAEAQWWDRQTEAARDAGVFRAVLPGESLADAPCRWHEVLHDAGVDAVCVCGPQALRAELTMEALQAGKHVLAMPPVASDLANGRRLAETALDRGLILHTALPDRHRPAFAELRTWMTAGATGDLLVLTCRAGRLALHAPGAASSDSIEVLLARATGVTWWLMGGFAEVMGLDSPAGDTSVAFFNHGTGSVAWVQASLAEDTVAFEVEITGRNAYATAYSGGEGLERATLGPRDLTGPFRETVVQSVRPDTYGAGEWKTFAAAVRAKGPRAAADDTLALIRLFLAARRSAQTGAAEVAQQVPRMVAKEA
jgi:predicted dehydrogenase